MESKLWALPIILILSSCGPHAPLVDDCVIAPLEMDCHRARPAPKQDPAYSKSPKNSTGYLCNSTGDFLVRKLYIITLENNLAKCVQTPVVNPKVNDCVVYGQDTVANSLVFCSDGVASNTLSWGQAVGQLCLSSADFEKEKVYRNSLIQDIAACTP